MLTPQWSARPGVVPDGVSPPRPTLSPPSPPRMREGCPTLLSPSPATLTRPSRVKSDRPLLPSLLSPPPISLSLAPLSPSLAGCVGRGQASGCSPKVRTLGRGNLGGKRGMQGHPGPSPPHSPPRKGTIWGQRKRRRGADTGSGMWGVLGPLMEGNRAPARNVAMLLGLRGMVPGSGTGHRGQGDPRPRGAASPPSGAPGSGTEKG